MPKFSPEEIERMNEYTLEKTRSDFAGFKEATMRGVCWICKDSLTSFYKAKPCMHWLLMPPGFRKKHFPLVYQNFEADRIEAFLRWHATARAAVQRN